jgi:predicted molibdopterin-dependent oxidoreductase YjgC
MCDEGRFGFGWIDRDRLTRVRRGGAESNWDEAIPAIAAELPRGPRLGVIASAKLSVEELFLIARVFRDTVGGSVTAAVPEPAGSSDDFLIKADKNPNTLGANALGLSAPNARQLVDDALEGRIEALWVFGHDIAALFGHDTLARLSRSLRLLIFSGTNENPTAASAHWTLPSAAYLEKDGTFVNCHGRIQRIGCVFPPLPDSREDWRFLLELARELKHPFPWSNPREIFESIDLPQFAGLTYDAIGSQGAALRPPC